MSKPEPQNFVVLRKPLLLNAFGVVNGRLDRHSTELNVRKKKPGEVLPHSHQAYSFVTELWHG